MDTALRCISSRGTLWRREAIDLLFWPLRMRLHGSSFLRQSPTGLRVIDLSGAWRLKDKANRAIYS